MCGIVGLLVRDPALEGDLGQYFSTFFVQWTGARVVMDLRNAAFSKLQELSLDYYSKSRAGDILSDIGPATAGILTGSLVVERMFAIPGIGSHFIEAVFARDYTLAMGMVLVYTVLLVTMNTLVDLSYAVIDPRVKIQ